MSGYSLIDGLHDTYRVAFIVLGWVNTGTRSTVCGHGLIPVFAEMEGLLVLVVVNTLDYLGPH